MSVEVSPVTPADAPLVAALMAAESNGCFCRWWLYTGEDYDWTARCNLTPETNRVELEAELAATVPAIVARDAGAVIGWLRLGPSDALAKPYRRRPYRRMPYFEGDRSGVWVIGCLLVARAARRRGVATALIEAAIAHARSAGAEALEALPRRPREQVRDEELFMGPAGVYARLGFEELGGPPPYPVLRLALR